MGDCFIYTNSENRLNYYVGGEIVTISHLDRTQYILGYITKDSKLYLGDKDLNVTSFALKTAGLLQIRHIPESSETSPTAMSPNGV